MFTGTSGSLVTISPQVWMTESPRSRRLPRAALARLAAHPNAISNYESALEVSEDLSANGRYHLVN